MKGTVLFKLSNAAAARLSAKRHTLKDFFRRDKWQNNLTNGAELKKSSSK